MTALAQATDGSYRRPMATSDIDVYRLVPNEIARDTVERLLARIHRIREYLGDRDAKPANVAQVAARSPIAEQVRLLVDFAQRGGAAGWSGAEDARAALTEILDAMWEPVGARIPPKLTKVEGIDDTILDEQHDMLHLVILAAWCRIQIARGEPVSLRALGALAGRSPRRMQALASDGEIPVTGTTKHRKVRAIDAGRWLGGRDVPGFSPKP